MKVKTAPLFCSTQTLYLAGISSSLSPQPPLAGNSNPRQ